ncbi:heme exporter protein CcmB [Bernardetia sp. OM2101]|uniref:heme exporter protein CcmB n=1 Tax=Bernardetia sp. OM2101 TaxID=3344876 RepID=UPI0035D04142
MTNKTNAISQILTLLQKEFRLEWRQRIALNSILLYLAATIFVCYLSFSLQKLPPLVWNALFWIILIFASINAIAKSFVQESEGRYMYFYTLFKPEVLIIAKMIYNTFLMLLISFLGIGAYIFVMGTPVQDWNLFLLIILLGSIGFATSLTLISSISAQTENSSMLMAILSFPIILPLVLLLIDASKNAIDGLAWSVSKDEILLLVGMDLILAALAYILFPFLWRS